MTLIARGSVTATDRRDSPREEVFYRTRLVRPDGSSAPVQIVDISASGVMARTEIEFSPGDTLRIRLPVIGEVTAHVRWALGGRIGCQFERTIELAPYLELLGALAGSAR